MTRADDGMIDFVEGIRVAIKGWGCKSGSYVKIIVNPGRNRSKGGISHEFGKRHFFSTHCDGWGGADCGCCCRWTEKG